MSSDSESEDYSSFTETDYSDEEVSCSQPNEPCRPVPRPIRRLVDIAEPSSEPRYNFTVTYNDHVPTGSRIEIAPNQRQLPFKPRAPMPPGERDQTDTMWGGRFGTHDRTEMYGFEQSKQNTHGMPMDDFSPASYPFSSEDGFNTKNHWLGGIGPLPQFGSRVKQGMGDVSQQILERYTGARGFKQPKREVELSHPRHRQLPNKMVDLGQMMDRAKDSLKDKKPFELPFQQGRDTGNRTMPFGGDPLQPPIRVLPTQALRATQHLNVRVNNLPSQAQANPNGHWMQGTGPLPESREVMFDYSDQVRTPAPEPTTAFQPPLLQAPIRMPITNRADTSIGYTGPINNSSANAVQMPENFQNLKVKILPPENSYLGPVGNDSAGAPGHVATNYTAKMTQREGYDFTPQPGPAFGGGQTPMPLMDQVRATQREQLSQEVMLPRIVRSDIGVGPMPIAPMRTTGKEVTEMASIQGPMQNPSGGSAPMPLMDQMRPTLRQALEEIVQPPRQQLPQGGVGPMPLMDLPRITMKQATEGVVQQPRQQLPQGLGAGPMPLMDQQRTTMKQATESAVQQGRINSMIGGGAGPMPQLDPVRMTQREETGQMVMPGRIGGAATGSAPTRRYDDQQRETRRQTMAENPELGPAFNSSASVGGHMIAGVQAPLNERNLGCMEHTHSFGPVSSDVKAPTDRTYIRNMTFDDRKEVGLYNRIPGPDRFPNIPKTIFPLVSMPSDDRLDTTRTGNIDLSRENQARIVPLQSFNPNKDLPQLDQYRFVQPYQTEQLRINPYATDIRVMGGQPQY